MSVTIDSIALPDLLAHPVAWSGSNAQRGLVIPTWNVRGLCQDDTAEAIYQSFCSWQDLRLMDPIPTSKTDVGTTVSFTADVAGGGAVSGLAVWFSEAPKMERVGAYFDVSFSVVDALKSMNIQDKELKERPDLGTFSWGGAVLTLLKPPEEYQSIPLPELTASGKHYYTGPLKAVRKRSVSGETDAVGWAAIQAYIEASSPSPPASGWWLLSPPSASAEIKGGFVRYTVSLELVELQA